VAIKRDFGDAGFGYHFIYARGTHTVTIKEVMSGQQNAFAG
jgi:hypothetical protein